MGKHDEIWQSINDLDDRVTRLEERATPQVETPTATIPPRPFRVGDVVRLEAWGYNIQRVPDWTYVYKDKRKDPKVYEDTNHAAAIAEAVRRVNDGQK